MANKDLGEIGETMKDIDFCMLTTRRGDGGMSARPMSNNRDVQYDGDTYFYSDGNTEKVREIEADPHVT
ncbi:MAG TPA: pyridoxamine 5'-phosphate oxidase family protein, partial [Sphingomicrobium sp.]|nr:pyridoxamine 5'-phosphate oxidase family protein [Sphingomicrobium sp.]